MHFDNSYDIPYLAGYSKDGKTVYFDCDLPMSYRQKDGKEVGIYKYLFKHESHEKHLLDTTDLDYKDAHARATNAERALLEKDGFNWPEYDAFMQAQALRCSTKKIRNVPADLDTTPYEDEKDHNAMKHIENAAIKRLSSAKKKEIETLNEQLDTLLEASRRVTSMPKKAEMKAQIQSLKDRMRHLKEQAAVVQSDWNVLAKKYPKIKILTRDDEKLTTRKGDDLKRRLAELLAMDALNTISGGGADLVSNRAKLLVKAMSGRALGTWLQVFDSPTFYEKARKTLKSATKMASLETAGAWPKDFFTALCKASKTSTDDEGSFTEKKASVSTRGHYDGAAVDNGTFATRWLPILKTNRDLVKHDISVEVLHPTKPDKSFGDIDRQTEHVHLIQGFCLKAGKALKIKVAKNAKEFIALAKEQKPVVIVIPHPKHGFEILMSQEADKKAWSK